MWWYSLYLIFIPNDSKNSKWVSHGPRVYGLAREWKECYYSHAQVGPARFQTLSEYYSYCLLFFFFLGGLATYTINLVSCYAHLQRHHIEVYRNCNYWALHFTLFSVFSYIVAMIFLFLLLPKTRKSTANMYIYDNRFFLGEPWDYDFS